jgi:RNA recognition motif-containing protein
MFVGNLPEDASEESVTKLFGEFGTVRSIRLASDVLFIEMEGHEARAAIAGLDGKTWSGNALRVRFEDKKRLGGRGRR